MARLLSSGKPQQALCGGLLANFQGKIHVPVLN